MASSSGDPTGIVAFLFLWIGSACIGYAIGYSKGKETEGFLLGLLGPIGWVIAAVIQGTSEAEAARHAAVEQHRAARCARATRAASPAHARATNGRRCLGDEPVLAGRSSQQLWSDAGTPWPRR